MLAHKLYYLLAPTAAASNVVIISATPVPIYQAVLLVPRAGRVLVRFI